MSRLYDQVVNNTVSIGGVEFGSAQHKEIHTLLRKAASAQIIAIDNVADYFFETKERFSTWRLNEFPNIAPPFDVFWMEYRGSCWKRILAGIPEARPYYGVGLLFHTVDLRQSRKGTLAINKLTQETDGFARWQVTVLPLLKEAKSSTPIAKALFSYIVSGDGSLLPNQDGDMLTGHLFGKGSHEDWTDYEWEAMRTAVRTFVYPGFLALSFLHCKNVKLLTETPPVKLSKAYQKRHGRPLVRYHTLEITPMKEVLRREGQSETLGLKKALHICRGHFATYSEERPLFGRVSGTFWKPMHVRGTTEQGAVVKDYAVNAPKK